MSTRANIIVKDKYDSLWFYRHSDGYPEVTLPSLKRFVKWVEDGLIRNNVGQAAGWLIRLGAAEYDTAATPDAIDPGDYDGLMDWKVGAYEPTTDRHGDIRYLYTVDLDKCTVTYEQV